MSWKERYPDEMTCVRCLEEKEIRDLDRLLWCEECQARARKRAALWGWACGTVFALGLGLYIWFGIQPDLELIPAGWVATLAAALYLSGRVSRELIFGAMRVRNRRAAEARPPASGETPSGAD